MPGGKADVAIAVGIVHRVAADAVPDQQREDGQKRGSAKKVKKPTANVSSRLWKQAEAFQRKAKNVLRRRAATIAR